MNNKIEKLMDIIDNRSYICISVNKRLNIDELFTAISKNLPSFVEIKMSLPLNKESQRFISLLHERTWIMDIKYSDRIMVHLATNQRVSEKIIEMAKQIDGRILTAK